MAKRNSEPSTGSDKAKVRVIFAEVEGNNESVQEALRTMVSAMSRPVRVISEQKLPSLPEAQRDIEPESVDEVDASLREDESQGDADDAAVGRKPRGSGKKTDRNAGLNLVPDLDFRPAGKQALREFIEEKSPANDIEAVLAVVYYMQHTIGLPKIGASHVLTALKAVGIAVPVDLKQTIRNIKKSKMWLNFVDLDEIRATTQGDNFVEHEMNKSK